MGRFRLDQRSAERHGSRPPRRRGTLRPPAPSIVASAAVLIVLVVGLGVVSGAKLGSSVVSDQLGSTEQGGCDPLGATACLLPFPNDFFTVSDRSTPTGRRVNIPASAMPTNAQGVSIDPTEWNRNDGFSPGTPILLHVQAIDVSTSAIAPITDIGSSLRSDAPIVIVDSRSGARVPYWGELDSNDPNPSEQALVIHPAIDLLDGHHYIVALRNLR